MKKFALATMALAATISMASHAETWSNTEAHLQYGELKQAGSGGGEADTTIVTLQHAGGWEYGDNFFFIDHLSFDASNEAGSDGTEFYGEWYSNFSLGALTGNEIKFGPVKDIGLIAGFNWAPEVDSWWFLPGFRFALDLPGFAFANLDITGYMNQSTADDSVRIENGATNFVVHDEGNSYMVDFNWAYPFKIGSTNWSLEGHVEYIDGRSQNNTFGDTELESWILAQPQLRLDVGEMLGAPSNRLFAGIEYQYWKNKLGEDGTKDNTAQLLLVWKM